MARFRKGTTDHDGDGKMGGSLRKGSRFVKGTTDHDNNGERGGSLPAGDTTMAKTPSKSPAKPRSARKSAPRVDKATKAALEAEALAMSAAPDPQTGMSMTHPEDAPSLKQVQAARKAAIEEQFAAADKDADPEAGLRRAVGVGF